MKLVFNKQETAEALRLCVDEFSSLLNGLYELGFPQPLPGLGERWSIIAVVNWVNRQEIASASPIKRASRNPTLKVVPGDFKPLPRNLGN